MKIMLSYRLLTIMNTVMIAICSVFQSMKNTSCQVLLMSCFDFIKVLVHFLLSKYRGIVYYLIHEWSQTLMIVNNIQSLHIHTYIYSFQATTLTLNVHLDLHALSTHVCSYAVIYTQYLQFKNIRWQEPY